MRSEVSVSQAHEIAKGCGCTRLVQGAGIPEGIGWTAQV